MTNLINSFWSAEGGIPAGLIAYYRMDNDATDELGSHDGTATNITYGTGKAGQSAIFNGSTGFITVADDDALSFTDGVAPPSQQDLPFSVSFYVKHTSATAWQTLVCKSQGTGTFIEWTIYQFNNECVFRIYSGSSTAAHRSGIASFIPVAGTWYHIVVTYDGVDLNGLNVYVDSVNITSSNQTGGTYVGMINTTQPVSMGRVGSGASDFTGELDGVGIWDAELSQSEVDDIYDIQNAGSDLV